MNRWLRILFRPALERWRWFAWHHDPALPDQEPSFVAGAWATRDAAAKELNRERRRRWAWRRLKSVARGRPLVASIANPRPGGVFTLGDELAAQPETPTLLADEINALPPRVRAYIHDLETRADPAGDLWALHGCRENLAAVTKLLEEKTP